MSEERAGARLGEALEVPVGEERLARGWHAVAARAYVAPRESQRFRYVAGAVALAAAAAIVIAVVARPGEPTSARGPLALRESASSVEAALGGAGTTGAAVALDDGSVIRAARGAELEALENSGERFSLLLREGSAHFDVRPGGGRRWTIEAGLVSVEVVGTAFEVARDARGVQVSVERGRVLVRGDAVPDRVRSLGAGESIRVDAAPPVEPAPATTESETVEAPVAVAPVRERRVARVDVTAARSAAALLAEADAARREGRIDDALRALGEAARREGDPDAAVASLTRGRLALEHGRAGEAVRDLQRAIASGLPPRLEEMASARLVDALARSGDHEGAARAADAYLREHPEGAWRDAVTRAIAER